ncbi:MAG: amidase [Firmicutes bacterium]|nr:amidase [Bacillota bacterium]
MAVQQKISVWHQQFCRRERTPSALLEQVIDRIILRNPVINAFVQTDFDRARRQAEQSTQRFQKGQSLGYLDGIPIGLKDLFDVQGMPTTAGSAILQGHLAQETATVVDRLQKAGAVTQLGKLNLHEFAFGPTGVSSYFGPVRHPKDPQRMTGGSSSGSAAAVADGMVVAALGTDTGGSVRIPAALCGVVGLKPTYGRVSRHGVLPLSWTLDHVGPIGQSVSDVAAVYQAIAGPDPKDPTSSTRPVTGLQDDKTYSRPLRVYWPADPMGAMTDASAQVCIDNARRYLQEDRHCQIERGSLPELDTIQAGQLVIIGAEASAYHWPWLQRCPEKYQPDVRERLQTRSTFLAVQYIEALRMRARLARYYAQWMASWDLIVLPTVSITAPKLEETVVRGPGGLQQDVRNVLVANTSPFNFLGLPALTVPVGEDGQGLPVGLQLVGRPFEEERLLQVGEWLEKMKK